MIAGFLMFVGVSMLFMAAIVRGRQQRARIARAAAIKEQRREADRLAYDLAQAELADRARREAAPTSYPRPDREPYDSSALPAPPFNDYEFARMFRRDLRVWKN